MAVNSVNGTTPKALERIKGKWLAAGLGTTTEERKKRGGRKKFKPQLGPPLSRRLPRSRFPLPCGHVSQSLIERLRPTVFVQGEITAGGKEYHAPKVEPL